MIDPVTLYLLHEALNKPSVVYHAASKFTKTLIPRKSPIGAVKGIGVKEWNKKAIYAASEKYQAIPFGLERVNMMFPFRYTEEEVNGWNKACYLKRNKQRKTLEVWYYNHTPKNPVYLYHVNPVDFKLIGNDPTNVVEQWYTTKIITPIKVEKLLPNQIKSSWKRVNKAAWEIKKQKYKDKGWYK